MGDIVFKAVKPLHQKYRMEWNVKVWLMMLSQKQPYLIKYVMVLINFVGHINLINK